MTVFLVGCAFLFWPALVCSEVPVFRDAYHFYYPQAVWLDQCASRGDYFPLWQPNEGLGASVPGETTSALFYPLRLLWFIPFLDVPQRFSVVIITHLMIAACGMIYACSRWQLRREAGWLAGTSFALSCPVFFQHNNLVFLCSAAWIGFALAEFGVWVHPLGCEHQKRLSHERTGNDGARLLIFAASLALMVLAGDPQTAVNCLILFFTAAVVIAAYRRSIEWWFTISRKLVIVTVIAIGLSAIQWVPSLLWAVNSQRLVDRDDSLVQADDILPVPQILRDRLNVANKPRRMNTYDFSIPPWHLLTTAWPTLGGSFAPYNSRNFAYIPAEGRMWQPSLFFGIIPLLLLIYGVRSKTLQHRWLLFAALFAFVASLGNYSVGWFVREVLRLFSLNSIAELLPADHTSSLYGLMVEYFPGYSMFRYPAKWSTLCVASCSLFSGVALEQFFVSHTLRSSRLHKSILAISGCGLSASLLGLCLPSLRDSLKRSLPSVQHDFWLGEPSLFHGLIQIAIACAIPLATLLTLQLIQSFSRRSTGSCNNTVTVVLRLVCGLTLVEMLVAASCWTSFDISPNTAALEHVAAPKLGWVNTLARKRVAQKVGKVTSDLNAPFPAIQVAREEFEWRLGKLGLFSGQRNLSAMLSIEPHALRRLRWTLAAWDTAHPDQPQLDAALAWIGVDRRLITAVDATGTVILGWKQIEEPRPLCELMVEANEQSNKQFGSVLKEQNPNALRWEWTRADTLEIGIDSPQSSQLVIRQFNDGGWIATDETGRLPVKICGAGLFTAVEVSDETGRVTFRRATWPLWSGFAASIATLVVALFSMKKWRSNSQL